MFFLGMTIMVSSILKSINIGSFTQEVREYINLYLPDFLGGWSQEIAIIVCGLELMTGLIAISGLHRRIISIIFIVMFSLFVYVTGVNLLFPSEYFGSIESCGCFGELIHFSPLASFVKSALLWLLAIVVLQMNMDRMFVNGVLEESRTMIQNVKTYKLALLVFLPSWFSVSCQESIDHVWYIVIYVALCVFVMLSTAMMYMGQSRGKFVELIRKISK